MGNYQDMQTTNHSAQGVNLKLLNAAIRFNSLMLGLTAGTLAAVVMYIATHASIAKWGEESSNYLDLLGIFFPGYSVTSGGAWVGDLEQRHDTYWVTEDNMEEGNPMLALERGEDLVTLPSIWMQGQVDPVHDYRDPDSPLDLNEPERFVENYRKAGGAMSIYHVQQANRSDPALLGPMVEFFRTNLAAPK